MAGESALQGYPGHVRQHPPPHGAGTNPVIIDVLTVPDTAAAAYLFPVVRAAIVVVQLDLVAAVYRL
jgi:hypothetical protein